jgi:hypothetical protein
LDLEDCEFFDNETVWGFRYEFPYPWSIEIRHPEFSKEDGAMSYFNHKFINPGYWTNQFLECIRIRPGLLSLNDVLIFGGIIGSLSIAIVDLVLVNKHRES